MLGNYSFDLVRVEQELVLLYPVEIFTPLTDKTYKAENAEGVQNILERIFKESKTLTVIQSLLTQSSYKRKQEDALPKRKQEDTLPF
jgi:hypothetical protein